MPHQIDELVGREIRGFRKLKGLTQQELAEQIGITFQQLQKYETAKNRVSVSRLWDICEALKVAPGAFFPVSETNHAVHHIILGHDKSPTTEIKVNGN